MGCNGTMHLESAKDILRTCRGGHRIEGAWWQNEEVKDKVKDTQDIDVALIDRRTNKKRG